VRIGVRGTGACTSAVLAGPHLCAVARGTVLPRGSAPWTPALRGPLTAGGPLLGAASRGGSDPGAPDDPSTYREVSHLRNRLFVILNGANLGNRDYCSLNLNWPNLKSLRLVFALPGGGIS